MKGRAGKYGAGLRASTLRSAVSPSSGCSDPSVVGTLPRLVGPPLGPASQIRSGLPLCAGLQLISASQLSLTSTLCLLRAFCSCSGSPAALGLPLGFGSLLSGEPPAHFSASHFVVVLASPLGLPALFWPLLPAGPWRTPGISAAGEGARAVTACPAPLSQALAWGTVGLCCAVACRVLGPQVQQGGAGCRSLAGGSKVHWAPDQQLEQSNPQTWGRGVLAQLGALLSCTMLK